MVWLVIWQKKSDLMSNATILTCTWLNREMSTLRTISLFVSHLSSMPRTCHFNVVRTLYASRRPPTSATFDSSVRFPSTWKSNWLCVKAHVRWGNWAWLSTSLKRLKQFACKFSQFNIIILCNRFSWTLEVINKQEAQLMLTNPRDAFRGQPWSPNIVPFVGIGYRRRGQKKLRWWGYQKVEKVLG